jgi:hypothetical protein
MKLSETEVLMAVKISIMVLWVWTLGVFTVGYHFGGMYCPNLEDEGSTLL